MPAVTEIRSNASTTIRAEWRLTTDDPDAIALAGESLRAKLENAHVFGTRGPVYRPTAYAYALTADTADSQFILSFVGVLSDSQRKAATSAAMTKARRRTAELAEIAGVGLADACSISSIVSQPLVRVGPVVVSSPCNTLIPVPDQSEVVSLSADLPEVTVTVTINCPVVSKSPSNR
jgi:hypothetical protein